MSENHKYYYLKLKDNFFDSEEMKLLDTMKNGKDYQILYLKLCLLSLKNDGALMFKGMIPYEFSMISTITNMSIDTVKTALELFKKIGLVTVTDTGTIYMSDIQLLIGQSSTEAERQQKYRQRITNDVTNVTTNVDTNVQQLCNKSSNKSTTNGHQRLEIEIRDKRLDSPKPSASDYIPLTSVSGSKKPVFTAKPEKTKKTPLRERDPENDMERVEKTYLSQWDSLLSRGLVKTRDPPPSIWTPCRALMKRLIPAFGVDNICSAVTKAAEDDFCLQGGYSLQMILAGGVITRLVNGQTKTNGKAPLHGMDGDKDQKQAFEDWTT